MKKSLILALMAGLSVGTMSAGDIKIATYPVNPIQLGESVDLALAMVYGGVEPYTYQWCDRFGNVVGTEAVAKITPKMSDYYTLTVTDAVGDKASVDEEVLVYGYRADATFDDNALPLGSEWYGRVFDDPAKTASRFFSGGFMVGNDYHPAWAYWDGFALSKRNVGTFDGTINDQYNCYVGGAYDGEGFIVGNVNDFTTEGYFAPLSSTDGDELDALYIANTAYLADVAKNGNQFAEPMAEGDYAKAIFTADNGKTIEFYLADFRDGKSVIVDGWQRVDFSPLGKVKRVDVKVICSTDAYPTYVCIDNISYKSSGSVADVELGDKPCVAFVDGGASLRVFNLSADAEVRIYSIAGRQVVAASVTSESAVIDTASLPCGVYVVRVQQADGSVSSFKLVKS